MFDSFESFDWDATTGDLLAIAKPHGRVVRIRNFQLDHYVPTEETFSSYLTGTYDIEQEMDDSVDEGTNVLEHHLESILVSTLKYYSRNMFIRVVYPSVSVYNFTHFLQRLFIFFVF